MNYDDPIFGYEVSCTSIPLRFHFAFVSRYLTFFYYLKEPKIGGETAFPIADNETIPLNHVSYFSFYFIFSLTILNWRQFFRMAFVRKGLFRGVSKSEIMCAMRRIALSSSMLDSTCTCLLTLFRSCELLKVVLIFSLEHLLRGLWGLLLKYWYPFLERWWFAFNFVRFFRRLNLQDY